MRPTSPSNFSKPFRSIALGLHVNRIQPQNVIRMLYVNWVVRGREIIYRMLKIELVSYTLPRIFMNAFGIVIGTKT